MPERLYSPTNQWREPDRRPQVGEGFLTLVDAGDRILVSDEGPGDARLALAGDTLVVEEEPPPGDARLIRFGDRLLVRE